MGRPQPVDGSPESLATVAATSARAMAAGCSNGTRRGRPMSAMRTSAPGPKGCRKHQRPMASPTPRRQVLEVHAQAPAVAERAHAGDRAHHVHGAVVEQEHQAHARPDLGPLHHAHPGAGLAEVLDPGGERGALARVGGVGGLEGHREPVAAPPVVDAARPGEHARR